MTFDIGATGIALLTLFGIYALMAISLNLEYGTAGIPNFGQALFVSIGAYTAAVTATRLLPLIAGRTALDPCAAATLGQALDVRLRIANDMPIAAALNLVVTVLLAALIAGIVGYAIAYLAVRVKQGWFLALVLLAAAEIGRLLVRGIEPIICGADGVSGVSQIFTFIEDARWSAVAFMLLTLTAAALGYFYAQRLVRSPYGRLLRAMRENEMVALGLGKPIARVRAQTMLIGSALAAIAGVLFAMNVGYVSANDYGVGLTLDVWVMIVLGGLGNLRGALVGAFLLTVIDRATAILAIQANMAGAAIEFNYVRYILVGVLLLLTIAYRPQGLLPEPRRATDRDETP